MFHSSHGQASITLAIPAGAGSYAPEILFLKQNPDLTTGATPVPNREGEFDIVSEVTGHVSALPASAEIEVDLLKPQGDPNTAGDWLLDVASWTATGLQTVLSLSGWHGVRVRGKSGGTSGNAVVHVSWW